MSILNKQTLVDYMIAKHREIYKENITPIKLQKGLYFLFAEWGGRVEKQKHSKEEGYDIELSNFDSHLFDADFEAWAYGPVDRNVYVEYKMMEDEQKENVTCPDLTSNEIVKDFVDYMLERIFISNDFALVDMSHEDHCWKDVYIGFKVPMDSESIIAEYANAFL